MTIKFKLLIKLIILSILITISNYNLSFSNFNGYVLKFKENSQLNDNNNLNTFLKSKKLDNKLLLQKSFKFDKITNSKINTIQSTNAIVHLNDLNRFYDLKLNLGKSKDLNTEYLNTEYLNTEDINSFLEQSGLKSEIEYISPNYIYQIDNNIESDISNDSLSGSQWALEQFKAKSVWDIATGLGIKIGVIDTGIDWEHNDLKNQLWLNNLEDINKNGKFDPWSVNEKRNEISGDIDGIDNDKNGYIDDVIGYDFVDQSTFNPGDYLDHDPFPFDEQGHGTNISSVMVAEKDNKTGIAGFSYNSKVITARAFDALGSGESDDIASAIVYCAINGAKVLNLSFGERFKSPIIESAVKFAAKMGCVMVSSSGNNNWWFEHYPSDFQEIISVGASNDRKIRESSISNYGSFVDVLAPGSNITVASPNNTYKTSRGTSLSAPFVASLAAMLLELKPELTSDEILNIIQRNADDIGENGWDYMNSAGIINPLKTLYNIVKGELRFLVNSNELYIDKNAQKTLNLNANIIDPLLENYQILIATGLFPLEKDFTVLDSGNTQIFNQKVLELDLTKLKDTLYTIAIKVNRKNKTSLQSRIKLNVTSAFSRLQITNYKIGTLLKDQKREVIFDIYTNQSSYLNVKYKKTTDTVYKSIANYEKFTRNHNLLAEGLFEPNINYDIQINVFNNNYSDYRTGNNFQTINTIFKLDKNSAFPLDWEMKNYSLPPSFINPAVINDTDNNSEIVYFVANELDNGSQFGKLFLYQFDKNAQSGKQISKLDSLNEIWINISVGRVNGETLVLTNADFKTRLFKIDITNKKFNQTPMYKNSPLSKEWGAKMIDFDADGNDEMLCYNDTSFVLYKYTNNKFEVLTTTPTLKREITTSQGTKVVSRYLAIKPVFTSGSFISEQDLIFEMEGDIIICEFKNNEFILSSTLSYLKENGKSLFQMELIKNDDILKNNLAILTSNDADFNTQTQVQNNIWSLELLKLSTNTNEFKELIPIWQERFYGVRDGFVGSLGFSYKNSLNRFDTDNDSNQDIILCITPNMYIFNNLETNNLNNLDKNIGWSSGVFSNSTMFYDFDKNGKKELGVNFFSGTRFLELKNYSDSDSLPRAVSGFKGYPLNESQAYLEWDLVSSNKEIIYEIFNIVNFNTGELEKVAETNSNVNNITLENLTPNKLYNFTIRAFDKSLTSEIKYGSYSIPVIVDIYPHKQITATSVEAIDSFQVIVNFSGKLPKNFIQTEYFKIIDKSNQDTLKNNITSALVLNDTSIVLRLQKSLLHSSLSIANYEISIASFRDFYRTPTLANSLNFEYKSLNQNFVFMKNLEILDDKIRIEFSEDFDANSIDLSYFSLAPQGLIINLFKDTEKSNSIIFEISNDVFKNAKGIIYTITCNNLVSNNGNKITIGAGSSMSFVLRQDNLNDPFILPNPVRLNIHNELTISNLTKTATIEIFDIFGNRIALLNENDGDGGYSWDLTNDNKQKIQAGVYLYKITGYNDKGEFYESELSKFMVKD